MKKSIKIPLIAAGVFFASLVIVQKTNMLQFFSCNSSANEPGLRHDSKLLVSNIPDYHNGDFVTFNYEDNLMGNHTRVNRLMGSPGDVVQLKGGVLYINGKNADVGLQLKYSYQVNGAEAQQLITKKLIDSMDTVPLQDGSGAFMVNTTEGIATANGFADKKYVVQKNISDKYMVTIYGEDWNVDNFGPLTIPENKYFVLGDNRHNAEDSRYIGLIDKEDITGKVLTQL